MYDTGYFTVIYLDDSILGVIKQGVAYGCLRSIRTHPIMWAHAINMDFTRPLIAQKHVKISEVLSFSLISPV